MHTLRYVSTNVCERMRNSASTLVYAAYVRDKFSIRYEHATVRWYTLSYGEEVPQFCTFLYVRHKLDIRWMYATCKLYIR